MSRQFGSYTNSLLFAILLVSSCSQTPNNAITSNRILAEVGEEQLFFADLESFMSEQIGKTDSATLVISEINQWIKRQLLLKEAEKQLKDKEKDFDALMQQYKEILLLSALETKLLENNPASAPTDKEINDYFEANKNRIITEKGLFKGKFLVVPVSTPKQNALQKLLESKKATDLEKLEQFGLQYALRFELSDSTWVQIDELDAQKATFIANKLQGSPKGYVQIIDSNWIAHIQLTAFLPPGSPSPLAFEKKQITNILQMHQNRLKINKITDELFQKAKKNNQIKVFSKP